MYCKNCGKEIEEKAAACLNCGFANGTGNKFCSHCGKAVAEGQVLCVGCGFWLTSNEEDKNEELESEHEVASQGGGKTFTKSARKEKSKNKYRDYLGNVKKITLYRLIGDVAQILLILMLVFLPIFTCKYEPSIEDIGSLEEFGEALQNDGYLEKNFSYFDDVKLLYKYQKDVSVDLTERAKMSSTLFMFPLASFLWGVIYLIYLISSVIKNYKNYQNLDDAALLQYTEIKKSGSINGKSFKKNQRFGFAFGVVMFMLFDILFCAKLLREPVIETVGKEIKNVRYMLNLSGVSPMIVLVIAVLIATFVFISMENKEEKAMRLSISRES